MPPTCWKISPARGVLADRRRRTVGRIDAGQLWQIALAWIDGIAVGLRKKSPPMHDMIHRCVRAFSARLSPQSNRCAKPVAWIFCETRCDTGFELARVPVLQGIIETLAIGSCDVVVVY